MKKTLAKKIAISLIITLLISLTLGGPTDGLTLVRVKAADNESFYDMTDEGNIEEPATKEFDGQDTETTAVVIEETTMETPTVEETTTEIPTTEIPTTEVPTTQEPTTQPEYEIIDGLYKVQQDVLIEYVGNKTDKSVTALTIPKKVTKIEDRVFEGCKYIKKVTFQTGSSLTEIGQYAFNKCTALTSITLPKGLTKIGYYAFNKCTALKSITIPSTVVEGERILGKSESVTKVTFAAGTKAIPNDILKNAYSVVTITIKSGVTMIGNRAFQNCSGLKKITIPATVTRIKSSAFNGCTSLESVSMSKKVTTIDTYAFKNCTSLKQLELRKTVKTLGRDVFTGDSNLTLLVYANSTAKAYARENKIKWDYTASEKKRRAASEAVYKKYTNLIKSKDKSKYALKKLKNYVPQGVCVVGNYLIVSMYYKNLSKNSILLLYNKTTGKYVKKIVLPSKDHVGSITNVKGRLVVGLCSISTTDYVAVINASKLKKAKNGKKIKYDDIIKIPGYADFAAFDGTIFWAGHSANISAPTMYGYKVKVKKKKLVFTKKYSYVVPSNTQGVIVNKGKGSKRTFVFSQSYGRLEDSSLITYSVKIKKTNSLKKAKKIKLLPSMSEGIYMDGKGYVYTVFESGAGLYCSDPDMTSEIQVKNVGRMKYSDISKLQSK